MRKILTILAAFLLAGWLSTSAQAALFQKAKEVQSQSATKPLRLGGVLSGKEDRLVSSAKTRGVDPLLLAAIVSHETGNGKSRAVRQLNNVAGIMKNGRLKKFASLDESIDYAADLLARYYSKGRKTPEKIGRIYAPNTPSWASNVRVWMAQLS